MANEVELLSGIGGDPLNDGCVPNIDYTHVLTHRGKMFFLSLVTSGTGARVVRIKTGAKHLHIVAKLNAGLKTTAVIIEGVTVTADGTPAVLRSYNRSIADDTLTAKAFTGSTFNGGTTFRNTQAGFGTSPGSARSGEARNEAEYIFKPNTEYIFTFTPDASTDTVLILDMYEGL
jgi:hypothetical protein